jgi:hypothetical protein
MKHYIIDGNNVIGKIKYLSEYQKKDKQRAREQLVYILRNYFSGKKVKITLHFDGYENSRLNILNGSIIYSESKTADDKIKNQVSAIKNRNNAIVVSSDNSVRDYAKVCGCTVILSEEFGNKLIANNQTDEEELRIKEMNNIEEFIKLFGKK